MKTLLLALLIVTAGIASNDGRLLQTPSADQCGVVQEAYKQAHDLKPGMTRNDVERVWQRDGGASVWGHDRFTFRRCNYIKVKIDFKLAGRGEAAGDVITNVSAPYIEPPFLD